MGYHALGAALILDYSIEHAPESDKILIRERLSHSENIELT